MADAEVTYTKKFPDKTVRECIAYTAADRVRLEFDGWTRKTAAKPETKTSK